MLPTRVKGDSKDLFKRNLSANACNVIALIVHSFCVFFGSVVGEDHVFGTAVQIMVFAGLMENLLTVFLYFVIYRLEPPWWTGKRSFTHKVVCFMYIHSYTHTK